MAELSRLRWLCRRGMKELDVVLVRYLEEQYPYASTPQQRTFHQLLELQDTDLYALITGRVNSDDPLITSLLNLMVLPQITYC